MLALLLPAAAAAQTRVEPAGAQALLSSAAGGAGNCQVAAVRPFLNFGFRLESGYTFRVPESSGAGWKILTTVTPRGGQAVYLLDRSPAEPAALQTEGVGLFFVGQGHYAVDWLLLDGTGSSCRGHWEVDAVLPAAQRSVKLAIPPNTVLDAVSAGGGRAPALQRITVMLDAAPLTPEQVRVPEPFPANTMGGGGAGRGTRPGRAQAPSAAEGSAAATLRPGDRIILLGALSALLEQLPAAEVRLVVFSLDQRKELLRREGFRAEALSEVAAALRQVPDTIDVAALRFRTGFISLLAGLLNRELRAQPPADAVIFLGARECFTDSFPNHLLDRRRDPLPRFYFLACRLPRPSGIPGPYSVADASFGGIELTDDSAAERAMRRSATIVVSSPPAGTPDTLSRAIAKLGGKTFTVETPAQFAKAVRVLRAASRP